MNANGKHVPQDVGWGLNVVDSGFDGPWAEAFSLDLLPERDGDVLMPGHEPVRSGNLVEENASNREEAGPKNGLYQGL